MMLAIGAQHLNFSVGKSDGILNNLLYIYQSNQNNFKATTNRNGSCKDHQMIMKSKILQCIKEAVAEGPQFNEKINAESGPIIFIL